MHQNRMLSQQFQESPFIVGIEPHVSDNMSRRSGDRSTTEGLSPSYLTPTLEHSALSRAREEAIPLLCSGWGDRVVVYQQNVFSHDAVCLGLRGDGVFYMRMEQ